MDNYEVAIHGVALAARILNIKTPDVQFFNDKNYTKIGINSVFLKDKWIIGFNEAWIESADPLEIQVTCFHETRHAFQWKCINGDYSGNRNIDSEMVDIWNSEMSNYNQPTRSDVPEEDYLKQEIEIDAIAFAHYLTKKLYNVKTMIPNIIRDKVESKLPLY